MLVEWGIASSFPKLLPSSASLPGICMCKSSQEVFSSQLPTPTMEGTLTPKEHIESIRKTKFSIGGEPNPLTEDLHQSVKNLSAELYAKDVHFLMEIIQNIESICSVGRSTKKGQRQQGYIGEKDHAKIWQNLNFLLWAQKWLEPPLEKPKWIKHYCSSQKILLVGEGDFSFSACLAKAFGSATNMVATSLDSLDFLQTNYAKAMSNINYLKNRGCTVRHVFDATAMYNNRHLLNYDSPGFDRIVYNFPLAGFFKGQSSEYQLKRNRHLVRSFLGNARKMLPDDGEIHITHKSNGFFLEWDLEDLATKCGLRLIEQVEFNLSDYPGYHTKYGFGGDNNFNCKPSKTYKFGHQ